MDFFTILLGILIVLTIITSIIVGLIFTKLAKKNRRSKQAIESMFTNSLFGGIFGGIIGLIIGSFFLIKIAEIQSRGSFFGVFIPTLEMMFGWLFVILICWTTGMMAGLFFGRFMAIKHER
jgi:uncharacterized protein YacL